MTVTIGRLLRTSGKRGVIMQPHKKTATNTKKYVVAAGIISCLVYYLSTAFLVITAPLDSVIFAINTVWFKFE